MERIIVGSDFECVAVDASGNLYNLFKDSNKENPYIVFYEDNEYFITNDSGSIECSIPPYVFDESDPLQFYKRITSGLNAVRSELVKINPDLRLVFIDSINSDVTRKLKSFEANIYTGVNRDLLKGIDSNRINNGLHIHLSGIPEILKFQIIKKLDFSIGLRYKIKSLFLKKRSPYGKLGSFRDCYYNPFYKGFEYRTLGSIMLKESNLKFCSRSLNKVLKDILIKNGAV